MRRDEQEQAKSPENLYHPGRIQKEANGATDSPSQSSGLVLVDSLDPRD